MENIFSNLSKQIHFDNLLGMKNISYDMNNVMILRPMLSLSKKEIIEFADNYNIPYLTDSTPSWSKRGQMRDKLIPSIAKFDAKILDGLYKFALHSQNLSNQWILNFKKWYTTNVKIINNNKLIIKMDLFFIKNYSQTDFWIHIWFTTKFKSRPSNKSFNNLSKLISLNKQTFVHLNKHFICQINQDNLVISKC